MIMRLDVSIPPSATCLVGSFLRRARRVRLPAASFERKSRVVRPVSTRHRMPLALVVPVFIVGSSVVTLDAAQQPPPTSLDNALPPAATGTQIFQLACATCHGVDGAGSAPDVVGFKLPLPDGHDFPDFNDCATNTVEPMADWIAVVHRGGPVRGLDRRMPAFGDALTVEQIKRVVDTSGASAPIPHGRVAT